MKIEAHPENHEEAEPEETATGYVVEYPEPTPEDLLASYRTYREIGGTPFEPYETKLEQQITTEMGTGEPAVGNAKEQLDRLISPQP